MELYTRTDANPDIEVTTKEYMTHGVVVPEGFPFDGASAPRIFWGVIPPFKRTKKASCIHDWLCKQAKNKEDRLFADTMFFLILKHEGKLSDLRCDIGYIGVRIGAFLGIGVHYKHWSDIFKRR